MQLVTLLEQLKKFQAVRVIYCGVTEGSCSDGQDNGVRATSVTQGLSPSDTLMSVSPNTKLFHSQRMSHFYHQKHSFE